MGHTAHPWPALATRAGGTAAADRTASVDFVIKPLAPCI